MKILIVNKFLYPRGGAETYIDRIGRALKSLGHSVQYFGMCDRRNTMGNELGLETGAMDFHSRSLSRFTYPLRILYSTEASRKLLAEVYGELEREKGSTTGLPGESTN